jgi:hypothetical protein
VSFGEIKMADVLARFDEEHLTAMRDALAKETAIREVMAESGESREVVEEAIGAMDAMAGEAVLDLTEGEPTTLRDALERYVAVLEERDEILARDWVLSDLAALLTYPFPAGATGLAIDPEDSLERKPGEPEGYHRRETITLEGYPLMGSSPAERAESLARGERIRREAMRDHLFVQGDGPHCAAMLPVGASGSPETGVVTMTAACGYPRETHPDTL